MTLHRLRCPLLFAFALSLTACAGNSNRQLADLQIELRAERELLKETRAELQALMRRMEPLLTAVELLKAEATGEESKRPQLSDETSVAVSAESAEGITRVDATHYIVTREARDSMLSDSVAMARSARVVPSIKGGKANGFKIYAVRPSSPLASLGLQNGDTIHRINSSDLSSPDKALEIYTRLRTETRIDLEITRRGVAMTLSYEIR